MSRWLWALLGGVVLVAIAAVFWIASNQTNVAPPVSPAPAPVTPAPAPAPTAQNVAPSPPPPSPAPPPAPAAPPAPDFGARCRTAGGLAPCSRPVPRDAPGSAGRRAEPSPPPAPGPLANAPLPPPAPARTPQPEVQDVYAPKSLAQLVGTWAYSPADCERLFQRRGGGWAFRQPVDKFAQAAIVELPKRIVGLPPPARSMAPLKRKACSR